MHVHAICIIYRKQNGQLSVAVVILFFPQQNTCLITEEGVKSCAKIDVGLLGKMASRERLFFYYFFWGCRAVYLVKEVRAAP